MSDTFSDEQIRDGIIQMLYKAHRNPKGKYKNVTFSVLQKEVREYIDCSREDILREIRYLIEKKLIGILNDERREVESVHLGLIYHFTGDSPQITVKEKDKIKGGLIKLEDMPKYLEGVEGWPEIIYKEYLSNIE